ncbi:hypothetical protein L7F22_008070 [Adiantum nelumboides]|nr:hypothetical protein [Adiantum nelumboides]
MFVIEEQVLEDDSQILKPIEVVAVELKSVKDEVVVVMCIEGHVVLEASKDSKEDDFENTLKLMVQSSFEEQYSMETTQIDGHVIAWDVISLKSKLHISGTSIWQCRPFSLRPSLTCTYTTAHHEHPHESPVSLLRPRLSAAASPSPGHRMGQTLGCMQVDQSTVAIKEVFGKFGDVLEPGCHCVPWCLGSYVVGVLSLRVQQLDVRCETKSKDNVFVNVVASVQYRAVPNNAKDAFYKLTNPHGQIQSYVFDVVRATVPKMNLDDVFEQKSEIGKAVADELEKAMANYGFEIVQTLIVDIVPDDTVKRAMNEINAAARMRVATQEKAEAEKILQVKRAEAEAEAKYLSGLGIARQRQAIVDGLRESVLNFSHNVPGTTAKDVMDMVLVTQYFDTMRDIGASSKSSTVFIPHGPGAVRDVAEQIRNGLLQGEAGSSSLI